MATREQIIHLVSQIQFLPNSPITSATIRGVTDMFIADLEDLSNETLTAAFRQYRSTATFFPTPGQIREIAMDLQMLSMGVPTPAEAWGQVLTAMKYREKVLCEEGYKLYTTDQRSPEYMSNVWKYGKHLRDCKICDEGGLMEVYNSPAVESTVKLLGGREIIITDNPTADRARFIDAYREVVARERTKAAMLPQVKEYIEEKRNAQLTDSIKQLTNGMSK
jgi:hypothetical protein